MSEAPEGHVGKTGLAPVASGFHKIVHMGFLIRIARLMSWMNDSDQQHPARLKKSTPGSALNWEEGDMRPWNLHLCVSRCWVFVQIKVMYYKLLSEVTSVNAKDRSLCSVVNIC